MGILCLPVLGGVIAVSMAQPLARQPEIPAPDHVHSLIRPARTFTDGWLRINDSILAAEAALKEGAFVDLSTEGNAIAELAVQIGTMLLSKDVAAGFEKPTEVGEAVRELGSAAIALHISADTGNVLRAKGQFERLKRAAEALSRLVPAAYFCPMHCEGTKTYPAPGTCPACHMKLKKITSARYQVSVTSDSLPAPGAPALLRFEFKDPTGARLTAFETVHEKLLHLLMVSTDLSWYAHEHPEIQPDGTFTLSFAFPNPGEYVLFNDFTVRDMGMQVLPARITVSGTPPPPAALVADTSPAKIVDGYTVTLDTGGRLVPGALSKLRYTIEREGRPAKDLEPFLGAMGHLIAISRDLRNFLHIHPREEPASPTAAAGRGPTVEFEAFFDRPGLYRAWGQFQHEGEILTVPFTFAVRSPTPGPARTGERTAQPPR